MQVLNIGQGVYTKTHANRDTRRDQSLQLVTVVASCAGTEYRPAHVHVKTRSAYLEVQRSGCESLQCWRRDDLAYCY